MFLYVLRALGGGPYLHIHTCTMCTWTCTQLLLTPKKWKGSLLLTPIPVAFYMFNSNSLLKCQFFKPMVWLVWQKRNNQIWLRHRPIQALQVLNSKFSGVEFQIHCLVVLLCTVDGPSDFFVPRLLLFFAFYFRSGSKNIFPFCIYNLPLWCFFCSGGYPKIIFGSSMAHGLSSTLIFMR